MDDLHLKLGFDYDTMERRILDLELQLRFKEATIKGLEDENRNLRAEANYLDLVNSNQCDVIKEKNEKIFKLLNDYKTLEGYTETLVAEHKRNVNKITAQAMEIENLENDVDELLQQKEILIRDLEELEKGFFL